MTDETRWMSATNLSLNIGRGTLRRSEVVADAIERAESLNQHLAAVVIPLERASAPLDSANLRPFDGVPMLLKDAGEELADTPM
jgi:Asp-tRNA(Asn)/Glu-tRNA(Gln) amidotransferase A subunit family amidase